MYLIDGGERLGKTVTAYRDKYFNSRQITSNGICTYDAKNGAEAEIMNKISDICISMQAQDWLEMPERIDNICYVELSAKEQNLYDKFEKDAYMEFMQGSVAALNAASLTNKLLQFSNGAMYLDDGAYVNTNSKKLDRLEEIIDDANGNPILCFYSYKHDLDRITKKIPFAKKLKTSKDIEEWNKGNIRLLLAHPASASHGLNLQAGGNIIVWFGLTWSLELYQQANARLYRQGQEKSVIVHHLITAGTADEQVLKSLQGKKDVQDELLESLKAKYEK